MPQFIKADSLKLKDKIVQGVSSRLFGNMKFDHNREEVLKNRQLFLRELGIAGKGSLARAQLTHGNNIKMVTAENLKNDNRLWREIKIKNCDGLITDQKEIWLAITVADCLPIFIWDDKSEVVAVVHAGWRGTLVEISRRAVLEIKDHFSISPRRLSAYIGPSIGPCHFEVGDEVWLPFKKRFPNQQIFIEREGKKFIDLWQANLRQLMAGGLLKRKVEIAEICTAGNKSRFFSRRAGDEKGNQLAVIGLKN
jgi:polyphenol oxidase